METGSKMPLAEKSPLVVPLLYARQFARHWTSARVAETTGFATREVSSSPHSNISKFCDNGKITQLL